MGGGQEGGVGDGSAAPHLRRGGVGEVAGEGVEVGGGGGDKGAVAGVVGGEVLHLAQAPGIASGHDYLVALEDKRVGVGLD